MAGIIAGYRAALLNQGAPDLHALAVAGVISAVVLAVGYRVFKALERWYADVL
jgi:ABC-type polysaccharide/polyol phosphate export permease